LKFFEEIRERGIGSHIQAVVYTPAGSGTGHLHRIHTVLQELFKRGINTLLITGMQRIPNRFEETDYERIILPRLTYSRIKKSVINQAYITLYKRIIREVVQIVEPEYFMSTHHLGVGGELRTLYNENEICKKFAKLLLWRDIPAHPKEFHEWTTTPRMELNSTLINVYDEIIVFGEKDFINLSQTYSLSKQIHNKLKYCGYVIPKLKTSFKPNIVKRKVVISFGGGENRDRLYHGVLKTLLKGLIKQNYVIRLYLGLYWKSDKEQDLRKEFGDKIQILTYVSRDEYLKDLSTCGLVFTTGGYNSITECIQLGKKQIVLQENKSAREFTEMGFRNSVFKHHRQVEIINNEMTWKEIERIIEFTPIPNIDFFKQDGAKIFANYIHKNRVSSRTNNA
jgi:predicted glycosyltransferase